MTERVEPLTAQDIACLREGEFGALDTITIERLISIATDHARLLVAKLPSSDDYSAMIAERDALKREVAHERTKYDGMVSDRNDWRERAQRGDAEVAALRERLTAATADQMGAEQNEGYVFADLQAAHARIEKLREALRWLADASERPRCLCGLPTGTLALKHHALAALDEEDSP